MGKITAVCISEKRGTPKQEVERALLVEGFGLQGDAHGGNWHRQVSLLGREAIERFREKLWVEYGAFGENLIVEGLDLQKLHPGSRLLAGEAVLEVTQIGKDCHHDCAIRKRAGDCVMPREGIFARVLRGGQIAAGDEVHLQPALREAPLRAAVITLSDKGSRGEREDKSGPLAAEILKKDGYQIEETLLLPDGIEPLKSQLISLADRRQVDLILTTGGTGFAPTDLTPEATMAAADRNAPGIAEAMRAYSLSITPRAMLSRAASVLRGKTLIVNLPGSPKAVRESLEYILPSLRHGILLAQGRDGECGRAEK